MGGWLSEQERLRYDQYIQVPCSCVLSNTINDLHSYSDCDLNKFWQFILEQSIQVSSLVTTVPIILFLKVVIFPECRPLLELSGEVQCLGALSGRSTSHREINKKKTSKYTITYKTQKYNTQKHNTQKPTFSSGEPTLAARWVLCSGLQVRLSSKQMLIACHCKSLPFFYFLTFEKGRLPYIHPVGWLVGRLVGWSVGRLTSPLICSIYKGIKALY